MLRNCGKSIVIADRNERRPLNGENSGVEEETLVGEKGQSDVGNFQQVIGFFF